MNTTTVTNGTTKTNFDQVSDDTWEIWQQVDENTGEWVHIATVVGKVFQARAMGVAHVTEWND